MSATDPNGFPVSVAYNDPFWRPTSVTDQLLNTVSVSYYPTVALNTSEAQMTFGSSDFDVFNTTDPLGRPILAQRIETSGGSWDTTQMGYSWNTTGRVATKTMPCATSKGSGCSNGTTTITHDALGRPLVVTDGGGGWITNTYTGYGSGCGQSLLGCVDILSVAGPAPSGEVVKQVQKEYNGAGQLVSVCRLSFGTGTTSCGQANGGTGYLTTYNYNPDGTIASIVRGSQTHSFTYDALGRTLTAAYPESGTKYSFYDVAPSTPGVACSSNTFKGLLVKTYDANGTTTCRVYDSMNRVTSVVYSGTNWDGENKYFVYDSATVNSATMTNTLGRVAEAYTAPTSSGTKVTDEGFSYTSRGEVSDVYQWSTNSNGWYHTTAAYFANGVLNTLNGIPGNSGTPWTYGLDGKGRLYSATESSSNNMVSGTTYNSADEPCLITLGLGDTDTYVYDNASCTSPPVTGRMTSYTFSIGSTPTTFTGSLTWNANGTLRGLATVDGINSGSESETCSYGTSSSAGYDEFGRLLQVNCVNGSTNVWNQTFSYDIYNNVTKSVPTGGTGITWAPGYSATNNQYTLGGSSYDSNGNLLTDTINTYTWNQDNRPKAMTVSGTTVNMTYDAFGRMVEKKTGSAYQQTLISPVGPVALMSKQNLTQYRMPLPGGDLDVTGIYFYHKDNLGSVPLVSSRGGRTSIAARLFAPYGESYNNVGITGDLSFTGDYQDLVAGIYDTPNRELNPTQGRWISPDPAHASWNAYSYSTNPLGETDPSGLYTGWYNTIGCATCGRTPWNIAPPTGVMGGNGVSQANIAGLMTTYIVNGMEVSGAVAGSLMSMDAVAACPSSCNGFSNTGQYVQYVSSAGLGAQGYVNFSDWQQGLNDANGVFYTDTQYKDYIANAVEIQKDALADYISLNTNLTWDEAYDNLSYTKTKGGNANFEWTGDPSDIDFIPGYDSGGGEGSLDREGSMPSIHMPGMADGLPVLHLDTANPYWGFGLGALVHGFVDVVLGNLNPSVPIVW
jgi:RHS repeat-associated protein